MKNAYTVCGDSVEIMVPCVPDPVVCLASLEDLPRLLSLDTAWKARRFPSTHYVESTCSGVRFIHRFILGLEKGDGVKVDHWNHDGLDNRRGNLRACITSQNGANARPRPNRYGYKGVRRSLLTAPGRFEARIKVNYREMYLGTFDCIEAAARAYDAAARKYFGEFAFLNFPGDELCPRCGEMGQLELVETEDRSTGYRESGFLCEECRKR